VASVRIAILGAGNLGTTLGVVLAAASPAGRGPRRDVVLWTIERDVAREIRERHRNTKYLPDVELPPGLLATTDLGEALRGAGVVVIAVPSNVVRDVARQAGAILAASRGRPAVVSAAKGLEAGTHLRMSQVVASEMPAALRSRVLALSGPSIATELSHGVPTSVVLAGRDLRLVRGVRRALQTPVLRLEPSRDVAGVELGGVLKNAYALALGLCDGLGLGLNTKAALVARALPEMARLGVALGGRRDTFYGLAGLGDLIGTGLSDHSRNRRMGEELARRRSRDAALASIPGVVEGLGSVRLTRELAARRRIRLPLLEGIAAILEKGADPLRTIVRLVDPPGGG
jgi:glycerol-3-phosphate dehydrogenase (NAD(P)+)